MGNKQDKIFCPRTLLVSIVAMFFVTACVGTGSYYELNENSLKTRQMQTRRFETANQEAVLIASAQVLQDLGYFITESSHELGLVVASKEKEVSNLHFRALNTMVMILGAIGNKGGSNESTYDVSQKILVTIFTQPAGKDISARVSFARTITNNKNQTRLEKIEDEDIYKEFFDKLSQSMFLTAYDI